MFIRNLFAGLNKHLEEKQITVITGMRRVGKTTLLKMLMNNVKSENKAYFDLERIENRILFNKENYKEIETSLSAMGLNLSEKLYIFIDEIQLVSGITSVLKVFYDDFNIKFVVTGSSSFYIKNQFSESLAGRKKIFELYPLTFSEFLIFKGFNKKLKLTGQFPSFNLVLYNQLSDLYNEYLSFGGFPEVVLSGSETNKIDLLADTLNAYIEMDVKLLSDFSISLYIIVF